MNSWLLLLFALACTELLHNSIEVWGMRQKVEWLAVRMDGRKHGSWPIHIDTKLKTAILHGGFFIIVTGLVLVAAMAFKLSDDKLAASAIAILMLNYALTTATVDSFHREIGQLLRRLKH